MTFFLTHSIIDFNYIFCYKIIQKLYFLSYFKNEGFENISADGSSDCVQLGILLDEIYDYGLMDQEKKVQILNNLNAGLIYLKRKNCNIVSIFDSCSDPCANYGLSEKTFINSNIICDHKHTRSCFECNQI